MDSGTACVSYSQRRHYETRRLGTAGPRLADGTRFIYHQAEIRQKLIACCTFHLLPSVLLFNRSRFALFPRPHSRMPSGGSVESGSYRVMRSLPTYQYHQQQGRERLTKLQALHRTVVSGLREV